MSGKSALVRGTGTIGNLVGQVARALGASRVMLTAVSEYKFARARACGLVSAVNPDVEDLGEAIRRYLGPVPVS